jgi:Repeat of unknown function (DUF5648)
MTRMSALILVLALTVSAPVGASPGSWGNHFYTIEPAERDRLVAAGWRDESDIDPFYVCEEQIADTVLLHRFFNRRFGDYFYATDATDVRNALGAGYADETPSHPLMFVFTTPHPAHVPAEDVALLTRFWSARIGDHFYATDDADAKRALTAGYQRDETQPLYVLTSPVACAPGVPAHRVFRLYRAPRAS